MNEDHYPKCPECKGPLKDIRYADVYLNRDQWDSFRAGDYLCVYCRKYLWEPQVTKAPNYQI